ncbi:hypothetical protein [Mesorhizobium sp. Pch-S]|uniref:hypothetical protein n=1 Tax=Mesorhizobium sp. Pch-S TaxID=2082387 RepID=UPI0032AEED1B
MSERRETLEELLGDQIVQLVMERDGWRPEHVRRFSKEPECAPASSHRSRRRISSPKRACRNGWAAD